MSKVRAYIVGKLQTKKFGVDQASRARLPVIADQRPDTNRALSE